MKPDNFEQRLQRQPLRQIPGEWRAEILAAARPEPRERRSFPFSAFRFQLFPSLRWAALAAAWVVIFALNFAARDTTPAVLAKSAPPSPQMLLALRQQHKLLAELIEPPTCRDADKPKPFSTPRSQRRDEFHESLNNLQTGLA